MGVQPTLKVCDVSLLFGDDLVGEFDGGGVVSAGEGDFRHINDVFAASDEAFAEVDVRIAGVRDGSAGKRGVDGLEVPDRVVFGMGGCKKAEGRGHKGHKDSERTQVAHRIVSRLVSVAINLAMLSSVFNPHAVHLLGEGRVRLNLQGWFLFFAGLVWDGLTVARVAPKFRALWELLFRSTAP